MLYLVFPHSILTSSRFDSAISHSGCATGDSRTSTNGILRREKRDQIAAAGIFLGMYSWSCLLRVQGEMIVESLDEEGKG